MFTVNKNKVEEKTEEFEFPYQKCGILAWTGFAGSLLASLSLVAHPICRTIGGVLFFDFGTSLAFLSGMIAGAPTPQWIRNGCALTVLSGCAMMIAGIISFFQ